MQKRACTWFRERKWYSSSLCRFIQLVQALWSLSDKTLLQTLGGRLRDARKAKGWTQDELAHESGIDRSYIGGVERGDRNPSFLNLCKLVRALEADVASFTNDLPPGANR